MHAGRRHTPVPDYQALAVSAAVKPRKRVASSVASTLLGFVLTGASPHSPRVPLRARRPLVRSWNVTAHATRLEHLERLLVARRGVELVTVTVTAEIPVGRAPVECRHVDLPPHELSAVGARWRWQLSTALGSRGDVHARPSCGATTLLYQPLLRYQRPRLSLLASAAAVASILAEPAAEASVWAAASAAG